MKVTAAVTNSARTIVYAVVQPKGCAMHSPPLILTLSFVTHRLPHGLLLKREIRVDMYEAKHTCPTPHYYVVIRR